MKSALLAMVATIVATVVVFLSPSYGQKVPAAEKILEGPLVKLDVETKRISIHTPEDKDILFSYDNNTEVAGEDNSIQGLVGQAGRLLRIHYRMDRGLHLATWIEAIHRS